MSSEIEWNPGTALRIAATFLTRVPLGGSHTAPTPLSATVWVFPVVGAAVGLVGGLIFTAFDWVGAPVWISAIAAISAMYALTGGLHEDGLADVADGFGGGISRDRKLAIMRDSRIGTYGVSALIFSIGVRVAALASIAEAGFAVSALILAGAISRSAIGPVMALLPQARPDGLSAIAGQPRSSQAWLGVAVAFAIALGFAGLSDVLVAICVTAVVVTAVATIAKRQIGGQTGDVLGAVAQVAEIAVLVTLSAR